MRFSTVIIISLMNGLYFVVVFIQFNVTISSKHYHWNAKQRKRDRKAERWTQAFKAAEINDRIGYVVMPSPRSIHWRSYVEHRLRMFEAGMVTYANQKYSRLALDKYIESNRAIDKIAAFLTNKQKTIAYIGAAEISPNSPIRIRKYVRCPGVRKLVHAFKKLGNVYIRYVDEYYSSQTCAKCYSRFDPRTRRDRFKVSKKFF